MGGLPHPPVPVRDNRSPEQGSHHPGQRCHISHILGLPQRDSVLQGPEGASGLEDSAVSNPPQTPNPHPP